LLDQRDQLVAELNKLIKVSTTNNTDGSFNVFVGSGQPLVVGNEVMTMTAAPSAADASKLVIGLQTGGGTLELPDALVSGGSLGGLLKFRNESLDRVTNDLGRSAASLALTFNAQNALGMDLQGNIVGDANFVGDFFNISQPTVTENANNVAGGATVTATLDPPSFNGNFFTNLTNSDYELSAVGAAVTLTRLSDNKQWSGADVAAINTALVAEPQGFKLTSSAALTAGNSYLIKPTHDFASNISVNASVAADPRLVAAAAPMRTQPGALNATNTVVNTNTGTASISAGSVATGYQSLTTSLPITLNYNSNTTPASIPPAPNLSGFPATVAVSVTSGGTTTPYAAPVTSIPYISGATITLDGSSPPGGFSFSIDGAPNNGDKFTLAKNATGVSDGRNALALGQLQTQNTMSGKTASYQSAYAQLVSDTGNRTRVAQVKSDAQQALLTQSTSARASLSGVNLDEEAANLIMYQQAYQAAAKSIDIAGKLFDTLLSLG
jgi:flagellar hook-associated protein 1 FlgK